MNQDKDKRDQRPEVQPSGTSAQPDQKRTEDSKKHDSELLDEGIEETFPASDPVSVKITK